VTETSKTENESDSKTKLSRGMGMGGNRLSTSKPLSPGPERPSAPTPDVPTTTPARPGWGGSQPRSARPKSQIILGGVKNETDE